MGWGFEWVLFLGLGFALSFLKNYLIGKFRGLRWILQKLRNAIEPLPLLHLLHIISFVLWAVYIYTTKTWYDYPVIDQPSGNLQNCYARAKCIWRPTIRRKLPNITTRLPVSLSSTPSLSYRLQPGRQRCRYSISDLLCGPMILSADEVETHYLSEAPPGA